MEIDAKNDMLFEDKTYEKNHFVELKTAQYRASLVENVSYDVTLALPKGELFFGNVIAKFDLKEIPTRALPLDFRGVKISLNINGQDVKNEAGDGQTTFTEHQVNLAPGHLKVGANVVSM